MNSNSIYVDSKFDDEKRRQHLYDGQLFVYSPRPSSLAFTNLAAEMIKDAFGKEDPTTAQFDMPVEEFVRIFAPLKPAFIHHPETKAPDPGHARRTSAAIWKPPISMCRACAPSPRMPT